MKKPAQMRWKSVFDCQQLYEVEQNLIGLSQDAGQADFFKNPSASLFNTGLSNEPSFSRIYLAGQ